MGYKYERGQWIPNKDMGGPSNLQQEEENEIEGVVGETSAAAQEGPSQEPRSSYVNDDAFNLLHGRLDSF